MSTLIRPFSEVLAVILSDPRSAALVVALAMLVLAYAIRNGASFRRQRTGQTSKTIVVIGTPPAGTRRRRRRRPPRRAPGSPESDREPPE